MRRHGLSRGAPGTWARLFAATLVAWSCRSHDPGGASRSQPAEAIPLRIERGLTVAHALGGIDGLTYTNSLEALRCNHERGFRWFEVDLTLTADGELMCFHPDHEKFAGLQKRMRELTASEVDTKKYEGRFAIPRLVDLLKEADRLGDVVLVTDTKNWTKRTLEAVSNVLGGERRTYTTRVVLQAYTEKELEPVSRLAREVGGGVIFTLYATDADDERVESLAKQHQVLAVVADRRRFTPWLARRLHAINVPLLVNTLNDHQEVVDFLRAGADGFYTDTYLPLHVLARDARSAMACGASEPTPADLHRWLARDVFQRGDYVLRRCAKRHGKRIDVQDCNSDPAISGPYLAVPAGQTVHVAFDVEAAAEGTNLWFDVVNKHRKDAVRPREAIALKAGERRLFEYDMMLPVGSAGIETRLGMATPGDRMVLHRLDVELRGEAQDVPQIAAPTVADASD